MISFCPISPSKKLCLPQKKSSIHEKGNTTDVKAKEPLAANEKSTVYESSLETSSTELNREDDLSHSCEFTRSFNYDSENLEPSQAFVQSVIVLPNASDGKYSVYRGIPKHIKTKVLSEHAHESFLESLKFRHNISNPELLRQRYDSGTYSANMPNSHNKHSLEITNLRHSDIWSKKDSVQVKENVSSNESVHAFDCQCGKHHGHKFKTETIYNRSKFNLKSSINRVPSQKKLQEVVIGNENQRIICNVFWNPQLNFCEYKYGDKAVEFQSLWPQEATIKSLLHDGKMIEEVGLRGALWELCHLIMVNGPVSVFRALIDQNIISKYYFFDCQQCYKKKLNIVQV